MVVFCILGKETVVKRGGKNIMANYYKGTLGLKSIDCSGTGREYWN